MSQACECQNWCRDANDLLTNHHHRCRHYTDSLIDVWRVSFGDASYVTDKEPDASDFENGETITKERMHLEVYQQIPEFEGF